MSYEPRHTYNLSIFEDAVQKAVPWLAERLGPYPYSVVKIVEKPFYDLDCRLSSATIVLDPDYWYLIEARKKLKAQPK